MAFGVRVPVPTRIAETHKIVPHGAGNLDARRAIGVRHARNFDRLQEGVLAGIKILPVEARHGSRRQRLVDHRVPVAADIDDGVGAQGVGHVPGELIGLVALSLELVLIERRAGWIGRSGGLDETAETAVQADLVRKIVINAVADIEVPEFLLCGRCVIIPACRIVGSRFGAQLSA